MNKLKKFTANDKLLLGGTVDTTNSRVAYTDIAIVVLDSGDTFEVDEYVLEVIVPGDIDNNENDISYFKLLGISDIKVAEKIGNKILNRIDNIEDAKDIVKYLKSQRFIRGM